MNPVTLPRFTHTPRAPLTPLPLDLLAQFSDELATLHAKQATATLSRQELKRMFALQRTLVDHVPTLIQALREALDAATPLSHAPAAP